MSRKPSAMEPGGVFELLESRTLLAAFSAQDQLFIYLLNRARHDPQAYATEANLAADGVSLAGVAAAPPLAINNNLCQSAAFHTQEMADHNYFSHQSAVTGDWPNKMARQNGYALAAICLDDQNNIESIAAGTSMTTADAVLKLLIVDKDVADLGHRNHLLATGPSADFFRLHREIGVGHAANVVSDYGNYWAIHTAFRDSPNPNRFLTGVVYEDLDLDGRYDLNEGLSNVVVNTATDVAVTNLYGGYSIAVSAGQQVMAAQGGSFSGTATAVVNVTDQNVEVDFISGEWTGVVNFGHGTGPVVSVPANVGATDGTYTDRVLVTWSPSTNATSYEIWRATANDSSQAALLSTSTTNSYNDIGADAGTVYYYWVKAKNGTAASNLSASNAGRRNATATIALLTAAPDTLMRGDTVKLTATGVADIDGTISKVQFYRDVNGNGTFEPAADTALGYGTLAAGAWSWTGSTVKFAYGIDHVFARALDNNGAWSAVADATLTVNNPDPILPTAQLAADPMVLSPGAKYGFRVAYQDNMAVDASTIGAGDILVTGPNGFKKAATLVRTSTKTDGPLVEAYYSVAGPGGTWDFPDNGTYTVAMVASQVFDTNSNAVAARTLGTFDVTLPDAPDLGAGIVKTTLRTPMVPGDKGTVSVVIGNTGGRQAKGSVVTNLFLAADPADPGTFIPLGSQTSALALKPGQTRTLTFSVVIQADEGAYYLVAATNAGAVPMPESRTDNNSGWTVDALPLVWQFGNVATRKNVALTVYDADDSLVTFALRGLGTGQVTDTGLGLGVALTGTTTASTATVTSKKSTFVGSDAEASLGNITVGNTANAGDTTSLGSFTARTGNLHGDLTVMGTLKALTLNTAIAAKTIDIRHRIAAADAVSLAFGRVSDISVTSAAPIRSLTATEWLNPSQTSLIEAPWIGTVTIKGNAKGGLLGSFEAAVRLNDAAAKQSLATMTVAGWLDGAEIRAPSAIGSVTAGGLRHSLIYAGVKDGVTGLPDPTTDFGALVSIRTVTVKGLKTEPFSTIDSDIAAYSLGTITLAGIQFTNKLPDDTPVPFGLAGHTLTRLNYRDAAAAYSWPNKRPGEQTHPLPREQFEVNLA